MKKNMSLKNKTSHKLHYKKRHKCVPARVITHAGHKFNFIDYLNLSTSFSSKLLFKQLYMKAFVGMNSSDVSTAVEAA